MPVKTVAVTGAARGIGLAIAERFLDAGWRVFCLVRSEQAMGALTSKGDARFVPFDASRDDQVLAAAKAVLGQTDTLDALVNNAGVALSAPFAKTTTDDFLRLQTVNVTAPFVLTRELLPALVKAKGRVVNVCSTAARKGFKYTSAYCASKHALLGLTRALAVELAGKQVTVNAVSPGWTDTDMLAQSVERIASATNRSAAEARAAIEQMNPMGRAVKPAEVAALVHFLATDQAAAAITGADYTIDAGETV
ncbi:MAG: SDR family oxidoreductase [Myxococcaceae bacterium]|nr:SDR family oxidoreductase [Myxococcaceae bacterium]